MAVAKTRNTTDKVTIARIIQKIPTSLLDPHQKDVYLKRLTPKEQAIVLKYPRTFSIVKGMVVLNDGGLISDFLKSQPNKTQTRANSRDMNIIIDAKYKTHSTPSGDFDKLQTIVDRHNENGRDQWFVVSVKDYNETVKAMKGYAKKNTAIKSNPNIYYVHSLGETINKLESLANQYRVGSVITIHYLNDRTRNTETYKKTSRNGWTLIAETLKKNTTKPAIAKRPNYRAYAHDEAMRSILTKLKKANFNGIHTGVSLSKLTEAEKEAIKQFPTYFKKTKDAIFSRFPEEIEEGIALFGNRKRQIAIFKVGDSVKILGKNSNHKITKLSSQHKGLYEIDGRGWVQGKDLVLISVNKLPNKSQYGKQQLTDNSKMFQGKLTGTEFNALAPDEVAKKTWRLGQLRLLKVKGNDGKIYEIKLPNNADAWAVGDIRKNVWLIGEDARVKNLVLPKKNEYKKIGTLQQLDYLTDKAHIENNQIVHYFHKLGEVDGQKPTVLLNHEGFLILVGGNYDIGEDGIEN